MANTIDTLTIEGFKSIRSLRDFEFRPLNVLIGANGAGKSNLVGFFRLLRELIEQRLQFALRTTEGGADACLYLGPKITDKIVVRLRFGNNGYQFTLVPTPDNRLAFWDEQTALFEDAGTHNTLLGSGHLEAKLKDQRGKWGAGEGTPSHVFDAISSWIVYHFNDTSLKAGVRREQALTTRAWAKMVRTWLLSCIESGVLTQTITPRSAMLCALPLRSSTILSCGLCPRIPT